MKRGLLVTLVLLALAQPAFAWDPYRDELDPGDQTEPDPVPLVVPEGIYLVTDVYAGDTISRDGRTTTYSTATIRETPGTYARVLESVGTGSQSDHDGSSFNHRASLPDGRAVGGTYYEDFVLTPKGFVSVNIVFFQDDRLTSVDDVSGPRPPVTTASAPPPPPSPPSTPPISDAPVYRPASQEPSHATTRERAIDDRGDRVADRRVASAGVSLSPSGPILPSIEVLRGRSVSLWPRAFVDGRAVAVRTWRIAEGAPDVVSIASGTAEQPCVASWLTLARPGEVFVVTFEVTADAVPGRFLPASVTIDVRSPALLQ